MSKGTNVLEPVHAACRLNTLLHVHCTTDWAQKMKFGKKLLVLYSQYGFCHYHHQHHCYHQLGAELKLGKFAIKFGRGRAGLRNTERPLPFTQFVQFIQTIQSNQSIQSSHCSQPIHPIQCCPSPYDPTIPSNTCINIVIIIIHLIIMIITP